METVWFFIIAAMLAVYVVLDGFDFGAGILHLFVAKNEGERRTVINAIGPFWDGNEVWLLAGGGVLVFAFPKAYAVGFSGFYLPLIMALWLLILRGISIEFRGLETNALWRSFWDGAFFFSSSLMAIILGAALGNVIRGVPIGETGYFSGPLFTDFRVSENPGVLDWYTVTVGVFALVVLTLHGALFLSYKTSGEVQKRSQSLCLPLWFVMVLVGVLTTIATAQVRPDLYRNLLGRPWTWVLAFGVIVSTVLIPLFVVRKRDLLAFLSSAGFIVCMLAATAAGLYPTMLTSTINREFDLTIHNAAAGPLSLKVGIIWWGIAIVLAVFYFVHLFRAFKGKVSPETDIYSH
ncbi:MAG TPA: cytochrome d ubiquinol oxidase subunit II [Fimbriimonadales bacterium]|nr:cytochrome d ubiquinol oxidase subunit II [Fimbriimonadales bacterium]